MLLIGISVSTEKPKKAKESQLSIDLRLDRPAKQNKMSRKIKYHTVKPNLFAYYLVPTRIELNRCAADVSTLALAAAPQISVQIANPQDRR